MNIENGLQAIKQMQIRTAKIYDGKLYDNGAWVKYLTLYCGFDIETTTICEKAYMYIWQFSVWDGSGEKLVITGRKWGEFTYFIGKLKRLLNLRDSTRVIVWVANFSFEFTFIQHLFEWADLFAKESLQPLYARTGGVEFREALSISGGNLDYLARTYCQTKKLVGDLDYNILRNSKTPLTAEELQYCYNDVIILSEFSKYIFDTYIVPMHYIPLTATAILRHELKERAKASVRQPSIIYDEIKALFPKTEADYIYTMLWLFRGGYVHGRYNAMMQVLTDYESFDLKSSYPSQMLKRYYPVTPFEDYKPANLDDLTRCLNQYCCIMQIRFYGVKSRTAHSIESKSKCIELVNPLIDNGRIREADEMLVYITELDFQTYCDFYTWKNMEILTFQIAKRGALPRYLLDMVYMLFEKKESINKDEKPQEYAISKAGVNGMYGLTVTRLQFNDICYTNHAWGCEKAKRSYDEMISQQVLSPYFGIYITAWGRYTLLHELMLPLADYVIYSDTDSHKIQLDDYSRKVVADFNAKESAANKRICEKYGYDFRIIGKLGLLEWESAPHEMGKIKRIKCCGAKRYICEYENKGIVTTIAGLGKKALTKYCDSINVDIFEFFENDMEVPAENTGKLRAVYNHEEHSDIVTDEHGNTELMHSESSVALVPVEFTMRIEKDYYNLITFWLKSMQRSERR